MDLARMLDKCHELQWEPNDLDWSQRPRAMSRDDEMAIVQLFTDMAGIERLAGALFHEQERRVDDPTLRAIFATFVKDEVRHAQVAQMLADFYDVHHYRVYQQNPHLARFTPAFVDAVRYLGDDVANAYITVGELILDIALLRSINDYVHDTMSDQAMRLINRDESRHIAIDYHMVDYYTSDDYAERMAAQPSPSLDERVRGAKALAMMLYYGQPFFREVFFAPMDLVDPTGKRILEAFKRVQMVSAKPGISRRPFGAFMLTLQNAYKNPLGRKLLGRALTRIAGMEPRFMEQIPTDAELARAGRMSFDELAQEALAVKEQPS
ncbi:MAG TPA: hypothetical protein VF765_12180 [Polyangiaceae bacterium]